MDAVLRKYIDHLVKMWYILDIVKYVAL